MKLRELTFDVLFKDRASKALSRMDKRTDKLNRGIRKVDKSSERLITTQKRLKRTSESLASSFKMVAGLAVVGFAVNAVKNLGKEIVGLSAKMEMTRVSFETMLGSKEKAKSLISDIKKFSLVTPFTPDQLFEASEQLINFNFAQEEILPTLRLVGDISKGNVDKFKRLSFALAEVRANSRLMGQEARQMINAGFSPVVEIANMTGESILEVRKRMEQGAVSFEEVRDAMVKATSKGGKFFRAMEKGALTLTGLQSTLEGFRQEIFIALGDQALGPLKALTNQMIDMSKATLNWLKVSENIAMVKDVVDALVGGMQMLITLMDLFVKGFGGLVKFGDTWIGKLISSPLALAQPLVNLGQRAPENLAPRSAAAIEAAGGTVPGPVPQRDGGRSVQIDKVVENMTIEANTEEGGRAAAIGFLDELDNNADKLEAQFQQ